MVIDAHQHFWDLSKVSYPWLDPSYGSIYRSIGPDELEPQMRAVGVDQTVLVQSANSYDDTQYMLEVAERHKWVGAVVGWVPLMMPDEAGRKIEEFRRSPVFKGIRHLIHDEADPDWVIQERVIEGLRVLAAFGLSFDVVAVYPNHLEHVPYLAERIPNLKLVVDHLAKPPIRDKGWESWASQLSRAAAYPNVYAKVSGLNTAAHWDTWSSEDLKPYVEFAFEQFGAHRLMFGSDWPISVLAGGYEKVWRETLKLLAGHSQDAKDAVLGGTAAKFYGMDTPNVASG